MKAKELLLAAFICSFLAMLTHADVLTFDDISDDGFGTFIPSGYQSLIWSNFGVANVVLAEDHLSQPNGFLNAMISTSNVLVDAFTGNAEIDRTTTNFNLWSAYVTAGWCTELYVVAEGFRNASLVYDQTNLVTETGSTFVNFNFQDVDRVFFASFTPDAGVTTFAIDNLSLDIIPEPSTIFLVGFGVFGLLAICSKWATKRSGFGTQGDTPYDHGIRR